MRRRRLSPALHATGLLCLVEMCAQSYAYVGLRQPLRMRDGNEPLARAEELKVKQVIKQAPAPTPSLRPKTRKDKASLPSWFWERSPTDASDPVARAALVYCYGELLDAVQTSGLFEDSKEFVDMPMKDDPEVVLQAFSRLSPEARRDVGVLSAFLDAHFLPPGEDLVPLQPTDTSDQPTVLRAIAANSTYYKWAASLNRDWRNLTRRVADEVFMYPQRYSILRRRFPVVVPGGRFRESYYWDSYWIVLGLLACDMTETARGLVQNLLDDVSTFGFVPNGGRVYYLNRSQPPLLSEMVMALVEHSPTAIDRDFVSWAVSSLETEYAFWMRQGERAIKLVQNGVVHVLNRYWTAASYPRPESYKEDVATSKGAVGHEEEIYAAIAAAAESGWDFSSRWIVRSESGAFNLSNLATSSVLPVELNCYMFRMERNLARLHELLAVGRLVPRGSNGFSDPVARRFADAAFRRAAAMDAFMWTEDKGRWADFVMPAFGLDGKAPAEDDGAVSVSSFLPLWAGVLDSPATSQPDRKATRALKALKDSTLMQAGGLRTTSVETSEQWDSPNAWSPLQHMVIEGLEGLGGEGSVLARQIAQQWLRSNYLGWVNSGYMYEKYSATMPGARGEGGEYYPQVGFGWTNGVALHLLKTYPELSRPSGSSGQPDADV